MSVTAEAARERLLSAISTGVAFAAVALAAATAALPDAMLTAFLETNALEPEIRRGLVLQTLVSGAIGALVGLALPRRYAHRLAPLAVAWFVPLVPAVEVWSARPLVFLGLLGALVLVLEAMLRRVDHGSRVRLANLAEAVRERLSIAAVALASLAWTTFVGVHALFRHWRFESRGFDLGIQDNLLWRALHGEAFRSTVVLPDGSSFLSHHAELTSLFFVPIYALRPGAETLIVFQAMALGLGAIPLYGFAATLLPRGIAAAIAIAYLLYAPLHGPAFYDVHWLPISIPLVFGLFWALAANRAGLAWVLVALLLGIREDVAIGLVGLGLFLVVAGVRPRFGVALAAVASVWFLAIKFVVMASAGPSPFPVIHGGLSPADAPGYVGVLSSVLVNPAFAFSTLLDERKLVYLLHLFAPVAFLPLRRAAYLPLFLAGFFVTLLTTGYGPTVSIAFQYVAHWIPWIFGALVLELHGRDAGARRGATIAILAGVLAHSVPFGALFRQPTFVGGFDRVRFTFEAGDAARLERFQRIAARIPPDASVAATEFEVPHLSTRREIYTLGLANPGADYLLVALDHLDQGLSRPLFEQAMRSGEYRLLAREAELVLFERAKPASPPDREDLPQELR